ncbi:MAG: hypothetical protein U1F51_17250 [Burkholderiales bacterium]
MTLPRLAPLAVLVSLAAAIAAHGPTADAQVKPAKTIDVSAVNALNVKCTLPSSSGALQKCQAYTVPAGKRLVLRMVSYTHTDDAPNALAGFLFGRDAKPADLTLSGLQSAGDPRVAAMLAGGPVVVAAPTSIAWGSQVVDLVLEPGDVLAASAFFRANPGTAATIAFFGYLVDQ